MKTNIGTNIGICDRFIRFLAAVMIAILYVNDILTDTTGIVFLIIAGILTIASCTGYCPLYAPFGIDTSFFKKQKYQLTEKPLEKQSELSAKVTAGFR